MGEDVEGAGASAEQDSWLHGTLGLDVGGFMSRAEATVGQAVSDVENVAGKAEGAIASVVESGGALADVTAPAAADVPPAAAPDGNAGGGAPVHHHAPGLLDSVFGLDPDKTFVEDVMNPLMGPKGVFTPEAGEGQLKELGEAAGIVVTMPLWGPAVVGAAALDHGNQMLNDFTEIGHAIEGMQPPGSTDGPEGGAGPDTDQEP